MYHTDDRNHQQQSYGGNPTRYTPQPHTHQMPSQGMYGNQTKLDMQSPMNISGAYSQTQQPPFYHATTATTATSHHADPTGGYHQSIGYHGGGPPGPWQQGRRDTNPPYGTERHHHTNNHTSAINTFGSGYPHLYNQSGTATPLPQTSVTSSGIGTVAHRPMSGRSSLISPVSTNVHINSPYQRNDEDNPQLYTNLCVSKVPAYMTDTELEAAFASLFTTEGTSHYSEDIIVSAKVMRDVTTGASKSYGFVLFRHPCDAEIAKNNPPFVPTVDFNKLVRRKMKRGMSENEARASVLGNRGSVEVVQLTVQAARHSGHNAGGRNEGESNSPSNSHGQNKVYIGNIPFYVPHATVEQFFGELAKQVATRRNGIDPGIVGVSIRTDDPSNGDSEGGGRGGRGCRGRGARGGVGRCANAAEVGWASKETHQTYFNQLWAMAKPLPNEMIEKATSLYNKSNNKSNQSEKMSPLISSEVRYFDTVAAVSNNNNNNGMSSMSARNAATPFATPPPYMMFIEFKDPKVAQEAIIKIHGKQPFATNYPYPNLPQQENSNDALFVNPILKQLVDVEHGEGMFPLIERPDGADHGRVILMPRLEFWLRIPSFLKFSPSASIASKASEKTPVLLRPDYGDSSSDEDDVEDGNQQQRRRNKSANGKGLVSSKKIGVPPLFVKAAENKERRDERMKLGSVPFGTNSQRSQQQVPSSQLFPPNLPQTRRPTGIVSIGSAPSDAHSSSFFSDNSQPHTVRLWGGEHTNYNDPSFLQRQQLHHERSKSTSQQNGVGGSVSSMFRHDSYAMGALPPPAPRTAMHSNGNLMSDHFDPQSRLLSVAVSDSDAMRGAAAHNYSYYQRQKHHQRAAMSGNSATISFPDASQALDKKNNASSAHRIVTSTSPPILLARREALPLPPNYRPDNGHALTTVVDNTVVPLRIVTTIVDLEPDAEERGDEAAAVYTSDDLVNANDDVSNATKQSNVPIVAHPARSPPLTAVQQAFIHGAAMSGASIEGANFSLRTDIHTPPVSNIVYVSRASGSTTSPLQLAIPVSYKRKTEEVSVVMSGTTGTGTNKDLTSNTSTSQRSCGVNAGSFTSLASSSNSIISMLQRQSAQLVVEHSASTGLQTLYFSCPFTNQRVVIGSMESPLSAYVTFDRLEGRVRRGIEREKEQALEEIKTAHNAFLVAQGAVTNFEGDGDPISDGAASGDPDGYATHHDFGYTVIDTSSPSAMNALAPAGINRRPQTGTLPTISGETESTSTIPPPHPRPTTAASLGDEVSSSQHQPDHFVRSDDDQIVSPASGGMMEGLQWDEDVRSTSFRSGGGGFDGHGQPHNSPLIKLITEDPFAGQLSGQLPTQSYVGIPNPTSTASTPPVATLPSLTSIHSTTQPATNAAQNNNALGSSKAPNNKGSFVVSSGAAAQSTDPADALNASSSSAFALLGQPQPQSGVPGSFNQYPTAPHKHLASSPSVLQGQIGSGSLLSGSMHHPLLPGPGFASPPPPPPSGLPTMIPQFSMTNTPPFGVVSGSVSRAHPSPNHSGQWNHISAVNNTTGNTGGFGSYNVTPGRSNDADTFQALLYSQQQQASSPVGMGPGTLNGNFIGGPFGTGGGNMPPHGGTSNHFLGARLPQMHTLLTERMGIPNSNPLSNQHNHMGQQQSIVSGSTVPMSGTGHGLGSSISSAAAQPSHSPHLGQTLFATSKSAADIMGMGGGVQYYSQNYQPQHLPNPYQPQQLPQLPETSWASGLVDVSSMSGIAGVSAASPPPPPPGGSGVFFPQQQQQSYTQYVMPDNFL